jgi:hypothetical protein
MCEYEYSGAQVKFHTNLDCAHRIQFANNNRVLDLHFGWGQNGNEVCYQ